MVHLQAPSPPGFSVVPSTGSITPWLQCGPQLGLHHLLASVWSPEQAPSSPGFSVVPQMPGIGEQRSGAAGGVPALSVIVSPFLCYGFAIVALS